MPDVALESRIIRLETAYELQKEANDKALALQAREYDRRLTALNGEAARILAVQTHSVTRELFDMKISNLQHAIGEIKSWQDNWIGRNTVIIGIVALLSAIVGTALSKWLLP